VVNYCTIRLKNLTIGLLDFERNIGCPPFFRMKAGDSKLTKNNIQGSGDEGLWELKKNEIYNKDI
jgi:hypothetical protein